MTAGMLTRIWHIYQSVSRPQCVLPTAYCLLLLALLVGPMIGAVALTRPGEEWLPSEGAARVYAERALRTQRYSTERHAHFEASSVCDSAAFIGYQRELGSRLSDAWYDASQIMADAAMVRLGQRPRTCFLHKTVAFLDLVARPESQAGGFYPRADVDGRNPTTVDTYADDNALIGLAFLEARAISADPAWRAALLQRAASAAGYLIEGGLWDETFGGGFWWNSNRGQMWQGKPAQTTALAVQLFARLHEETGERRYAGWAWAGLTWLDSRLFDPASGLYRYGLRHWELSPPGGEELDPRLFSYDQGIMIEVHLLFDRSLNRGAGHLKRARSLAERMQATHWDPDRGGYRLVADKPNINTGYAAWVSQSLLALHAADPNPAWLRLAQANLDALDTHLWDPAEGGYFQMQSRCDNRDEPGCEHGASWTYDPTKLLYAQAWMQRAQALLALHLAAREAD